MPSWIGRGHENRKRHGMYTDDGIAALKEKHKTHHKVFIPSTKYFLNEIFLKMYISKRVLIDTSRRSQRGLLEYVDLSPASSLRRLDEAPAARYSRRELLRGDSLSDNVRETNTLKTNNLR